MDGTGQTVVLAGSTGDLGLRVAAALARRGATVRALVRRQADATKLMAIRASGAEPLEVDFDDTTALAQACAGAVCVVSTLNGLEATIIGLQGKLLDAAVAAGVPRFMPSEYSLDFTKTEPGNNRNLDLRRQFMARLDAAPIKATSVLNGMFTDLLTGEAPIVLHGPRRVLCWGNADQLMDFTTKDDVADFIADVALDPDAPRISRIAGDVVSSRQIAQIMTTLSGQTFKILRPGGLGLFSVVIALVRALTPKTDAPFPVWQGMQYMRDLLSGEGKLTPLDNARYGKTNWISVRDVLASVPAKS